MNAQKIKEIVWFSVRFVRCAQAQKFDEISRRLAARDIKRANCLAKRQIAIEPESGQIKSNRANNHISQSNTQQPSKLNSKPSRLVSNF